MVLVEFINLILKKNNFVFNKKHYLQIQGTAMGTKMAPSYANLFMANFEETFLEHQPLQPYLYKRYIDDVLMIWTHGREELLQFIERINHHHPTIKFTYESSPSEINFLDTTIYIRDNKLGTGRLFTN